MRLRVGLIVAGLLTLCAISQCFAVGKYTLAYWRQCGHYEAHQCLVCHCHVFNEDGSPRSNVPIAVVGGGVVGYTNQYGYFELPMYKTTIALTIADGSNEADQTPIMDENINPDIYHRSWECCWMYKADRNNPGIYDQTLLGDPGNPYTALSTKSMVYWGTSNSDYYSDDYELDIGATTYYQTFTVPAGVNRITACKFQLSRGYLTKITWTAQICQGTPPGTPIGPPKTTRELNSDDYWQFIISWGVNDNIVVPGGTYCVKITEAHGSFNIYRMKQNNYPNGQMYRETTPLPQYDLMGLVVGMNYEQAPLIITDELATPSSGSAVITWKTNVPATSRVDYGTTTSYGMSVSDANLVTNHSIVLPYLRADTVYHFKITSTSPGTPNASTGNRSFWTKSATPNLLVNPGFETGSLSPWQQTNNIGQIGGWCTWGCCPHGGAKDFVSAVSYGKKNGQLYQVVTGAIPGATYTARGWIWTRQVGGYNTDIAVRIGIHPNADGPSSLIVWSPDYCSQEQWSEIGISVPAQASKIAIIFDQLHKWPLQWNINGYDDCSLTGPAVGTLSSLKACGDGARVYSQGDCYVTATSAQMGGAIYVETADRSSGLRVITTSPVAEGQKVTVDGYLTTVDGERQIIEATVTSVSGSNLLKPLSMKNKELGGQALNEYTTGAAGAIGPNNVGLLVQTWGRVVSPAGTGYRYITDGSRTPIKVDMTSLTTLPSVGQYIKVIGICRLEKVGEEYQPVIKPRKNSDVVVVSS